MYLGKHIFGQIPQDPKAKTSKPDLGLPSPIQNQALSNLRAAVLNGLLKVCSLIGNFILQM